MAQMMNLNIYNNNSYSAYSSATQGGASMFAPPMSRGNPMSNMLQGFGMLFAGMDMIDNGQIDGSILQMLAGGQPQQAQSPYGQYGQPQQYGQQPQFMPPPPPQQQGAQQGIMGQMMQMMQQFMQMMMQMLGMGNQQQQQPQYGQYGQPQYGQQPINYANGNGASAAAAANPYGAAASAAVPGASASAAANGNGASAAASAYSMSFGPNGYTFSAASAAAASAYSGGQGVNVHSSGKGAWGDPHYDIAMDKNGDGKIGKGESAKFDHKGKDGHTYNLFQGDGLNITGKYVPHSDPKNPQVIGETQVQAGNDKFNLTKDGKASLNGQQLNMQKGETKQLADGTTIQKVNDKEYKVISKEGDANVTIKAGGNQMSVDPEGNFNGLGGILGDAMTRLMNGQEMPKNDYWEQYDLGQIM